MLQVVWKGEPTVILELDDNLTRIEMTEDGNLELGWGSDEYECEENTVRIILYAKEFRRLLKECKEHARRTKQ